jgi:hypothetical protein
LIESRFQGADEAFYAGSSVGFEQNRPIGEPRQKDTVTSLAAIVAVGFFFLTNSEA